MAEVLLAVGTRKGLFLSRWPVGQRAARGWEFTGPHFEAQAVYAFSIDRRGDGPPRLLAGADSAHWGPSVFHSDDLGATWKEPADPPIRYPRDTGTSLERVWQLQPGGESEPGVVYAGTEPGGLFRSVDGGESFELVRPLWEHPTRRDWAPGGGGLGLHTVLVDPRDARRVTVAVSTGGVYRTRDGGESWEAPGSGLPQGAHYGPVLRDALCTDDAEPAGIYFGNRNGEVYASADEGDSWQQLASHLPDVLCVRAAVLG
ncbi:WD40/YVTN/BNR-like repeat-containing protein [Streptomyces cacaoi]|nr:sialidase family protein [Streptomyces cacaoi]NNG89565.1 exo-alpha-sialidase [Streptomyces cacaoi]